ncbi:MAG: D-alanine--D-alanine ligase [Candidatus Omnitrophica bacterium]|nr:D-alanine--D-alanine ligase [Candidatus Omnitrophota bacterium]
MGGPSPEHEISLKSGTAVFNALKELGLEAVSVVLPRDLEERVSNLEGLFKELLDDSRIDVVFNTLHGNFGEDGTFQKILENLKVPYTGSNSKASYLGMDKIASRRIFEDADIPVPSYRILDKRKSVRIDFSLPLVVKPARGGSSIGVSIVEEKEHLQKAIDLAFNYDERIIIEEYIQGKEITVAILEDRALPVIQIVPQRKFYSYEAKYKDRETGYLLPAPIGKDLQEKAKINAVKAHRALGCSGFSRVDMILSKEGIPVVLEVNTIPGLTSRSLLPKAAQAEDISFPYLCLKILESAWVK